MRKKDEVAWLDQRGALLDNCFSPAVIAVAVAELPLEHVTTEEVRTPSSAARLSRPPPLPPRR